jgi:hypothetical protein
VILRKSKSINALDHEKIMPGDLAVTQNGVHVLAYLGERSWIEADPACKKVIIENVPSGNTGFVNNFV